jgi:stalled ribosome rescue protein Dom34
VNEKIEHISKHALVWIDHKEARVCDVHLDTFDESAIWSPAHHMHRQPRPPGDTAEDLEKSLAFFHDLSLSLEDSEEILIVGPATAKLELIKYVHQHDRDLVSRIVGVETVEHPSDEHLLAYAKKYFKESERQHASTGWCPE